MSDSPDAPPPLLDPPAPLDRPRAAALLEVLVGEDIRPLAEALAVRVDRDGHRNKGWAGQVIERVLGLPPNAAQRPDFGTWELKVVPLIATTGGHLRLKETMALTMFNERQLETQAFEASHLLAKLRALLIVARIYEGPEETRSTIERVRAFDLADHPALYRAVRDDYEEICWLVREQGAYALTGHLGQLVQPRPKGAGHGSTGMGFYARKAFVARMLGDDTLA